MGILDPIKHTMCPDIWTSNHKLWPHLKHQILAKLFKTVPQDSVKEIYLIGSLTGWQWTDTSDIDLNITLDPPELALNSDLVLKRKEINGFLAHGTRHPINFFWVPWGGEEQFWGDSAYGVYDILHDRWAASPGDWHSIEPPDDEFSTELSYAEAILRRFQILINNWNRDKQDNNINKIKYDEEELNDFCKDLDRQRKFAYSWSFGIPRKSWQNIVFKYIEGSELSDVFELFKDSKTPDSINQFLSYGQGLRNDCSSC